MSAAAIQVISQWLPFIILIVVWMLFMSRFRRASTFQKDCLAEMKAQTATQADIARNLERIAAALEQRKP